MNTYVFFHVGDDIAQPSMLVNSIRLADPESEVIQCSDESTPAVRGVTKVWRGSFSREYIMTARLEAFAQLNLTTPAIYLDTDMLVVNRLPADALLSSKKPVLCRRSFNRDARFNTNFRGQDYSEHSGKTLDQVYPILACCTATPNGTFWQSLLGIAGKLDERYRIWYGDQEALRTWISINPTEYLVAEEQDVACLPETIRDRDPKRGTPMALHFKGPSRKALMAQIYEQLGSKQHG